MSTGTKKPAAAKVSLGKGEGGIRVAKAEFAAGAAKGEQVPATSTFSDVPEIAFAGRSNVGKSSLLNMMLSRRGLARTSGTPGCTRQINFFDIQLAAGKGVGDKPKGIVFVDLPGYGYAKVSKSEAQAWKALLEGYLRERPTLRAVVILVDVRRGLEQEERDLIEFLELRPSLQIILAATKIDKLTRSNVKPALYKLSREAGARASRVVSTSAETGEGREALWTQILEAAHSETVEAAEA